MNKTNPASARQETKLTGQSLLLAQKNLDKSWEVIKQHHLEKQWKFKDFKQALEFTNKVGHIAESIQHHPDILLKWGEVTVTLCTHTANGLTEKDFSLAAQLDRIS